jgi:hypothetical protein
VDGLLGASWVHVIGARARSVVFPFSPPSFSLFSPGLDPRSPTVVPPARSATNGNFFFVITYVFFCVCISVILPARSVPRMTKISQKKKRLCNVLQ